MLLKEKKDYFIMDTKKKVKFYFEYTGFADCKL